MRDQSELLQQSQQWFEQLPLDWQTWLEDNIARGCDPQQLVEVLQHHGFAVQPQQDANMQDLSKLTSSDQQKILQLSLVGQTKQQIIDALAEHGYVPQLVEDYLLSLQQSVVYQELLKTQQQLQKREWLIDSLDQLAQLNPTYHQHVPKITVPRFDDFIRDYYSQHRPVILKDAITHWPALHKWNPDYFNQVVGDEMIEVQMNRSTDVQFERNSPKLKQQISMRDFVSRVQQVEHSNDFYMTANNTAHNRQITQQLYTDIANFADGYCDLSLQDQLCFLWFGPKGTFTPLHHDLTNNMLVQIYGRKKVTLVPALQTPYLYNHHWVFSHLQNVSEIDFKAYPLAQRLTPVECIIEPGEALFIPMGWWHTVESLDVSISVSFTHFNAPNQFYQHYPKSASE